MNRSKALRRAQMALEDLKLEKGIAYPKLKASMTRMSAEALDDLANLIRALRSQS